MYALLLALALPQADASLQKKISYSSPAKRLERLLPELSMRAGVKLKYTNRTQDDVLVVAATNVTVQELIDKIAEADGAEWIKRGDEYQLDRSEKLQKEQLEADLSRAIRDYEAAAERQLKTITEPFDAKAADALYQGLKAWDEDSKKAGHDPDAFFGQSPLARKGPINRLLDKLLARVNWRQVSLMEPGTHLSFSSKPNQYQLPFNTDVAPLLAAYRQEQALWAATNDRYETDNTEGPRMMMGNDPRGQTETHVSLAKVVLSLHLYGSTFPPQPFLTLYDADGNLLGSSYGVLARDGFEKLLSRNKEEQTAPGDLKLSNLSFDYLRLTYPGNTNRPALSPEWVKRLTNPQHHDPLSYVVSEFLLALANATGKMLVAAPNDDMIRVYGEDHKDGVLNVAQCKKRAELMCGMDFTEDGDWLVVRPKRQVLARISREDRYATSKLLTSIYDLGYPDPLQLGQYALKNASTAAWAGLFYQAAALVPGVERLIQESDLPIMRLYATLTDEQRRKLRAGGELPFSSLSAEAQSEFTRLVYKDLPVGRRFAHVKTARGLDIAQGSPTEFASTGLNGAALKMKVNAYQGVVAKTAGDDRYAPWTSVMPEQELESFLGDKRPSAKHEFFFGPIRELNMVIDLGPKYQIDSKINEVQINMRGKPTMYLDLPEPMRTRAAAEYTKRQNRGEADDPPSRPRATSH